MNEVQVETIKYEVLGKTFIMFSQKKEILDICSLACEKFTGGEKTAK